MMLDSTEYFIYTKVRAYSGVSQPTCITAVKHRLTNCPYSIALNARGVKLLCYVARKVLEPPHAFCISGSLNPTVGRAVANGGHLQTTRLCVPLRTMEKKVLVTSATLNANNPDIAPFLGMFHDSPCRLTRGAC